ncbi:MAG: fused DSP-PTPase phosphatase/NAD kinase-like protein, partial [Gammaproteobacteria bacterium]
IVLPVALQAEAQQSERPLPNQIERRSKVEAPIVLCIDDKATVGGQPSTSAYAKAAANGFRSVLTLRSAADGVDLVRERFMVEQYKMRHFNISPTKDLPRHEQIGEFLGLVRDKANHPMLINCAFAERVAPLMMIFRMVEQGWSEERAVEEASRSGLKSESLKKLAKEYQGGFRKKPSGPASAF